MKYKKIISKFLKGVLSLSLLAGCTSGTNSEPVEPKEENWAIYLYMCGSDLESNGGHATNNLADLFQAQFPEETKIVVQTGGSHAWTEDFMDPDKIQRWVVEEDNFALVEDCEQASMGDANTLQSFLEFATENYPADHTMVILWNHGGGTLNGCCYDENFDQDYLTLQEMKQAFATLDKKVDIVGFDACLMASIDVAYTFKDSANYLLASQEEEPAYGWDYKSLVDFLAGNPYPTAEELGIHICDSYLANLEEKEASECATLSLTDLSKIDTLTSNFNTLAEQLLSEAYSDPKLFQSFAYFAQRAENYGGNTKAEGYSDMVDIQDFVQKACEENEYSQNVLDSLNDCVVYKVQGEYRSHGSGLSFYYNYDGDENANDVYKDQGVIPALRTLYDIGISSDLDAQEKSYLKSLNLDLKKKPTVPTFDLLDLDCPEIQYKNGVLTVDFGEKASECMIGAMYNIYKYNDKGEVVYLGNDDDQVEYDYDSGLVKKLGNSANWAYVDNTLVGMQRTYGCDQYNMYSIPILVNNGEEKEHAYLQLVFDFEDNEWKDMGYRVEGGHLVGNSRTEYLEEGEEFTLLEYVYDDNNELVERELKTVKYYDGIICYDALPDGEYFLEFLIEDIYGTYLFSEMDYFVINNHKVSYPNHE